MRNWTPNSSYWLMKPRKGDKFVIVGVVFMFMVGIALIVAMIAKGATP